MIDPRWQIIAYLLAALLLRVVAVRLVASGNGSPAWIRRLTTGLPAALLRFAYFVGLPYLTLLLGVLPARYLGLSGLERLGVTAGTPAAENPLAWLRAAFSLLLQAWLPDLGRLAGLSVLMAVTLVVAWSLYRHYARQTPIKNTVGSADEVPTLSREHRLGIAVVAQPALPERRRDFVGAPRSAFSRTAYAALHWAFYRAAFWLLTGDLYLAVVSGAVLVLIEAWLCHELDQRAAVDVSLLAATATIFFFAPNLWLLVPIHWLMARLCWGIVQG